MNAIYNYQVLPESSAPEYPGVPVSVLRLTSPEIQKEWIVTYREDDKALLKIEAVAQGVRRFRARNLYGDAHVMFTLGAVVGVAIFDWPKFPLSPQNANVAEEDVVHQAGTHVLGPPGSDSNPGGFTALMQLVPGSTDYSVSFTRTDPNYHVGCQVSMIFDGGKWWKSAEITRAQDSVIVGTRLD